MEYCKNCGCNLKELGKFKNTRKFVCVECYAETAIFIANKECKHEYDERSKDICIQCGKSSIHYA